MFCPRCGAENEEGNRFCVNCGAGLPRRRDADGESEPDADAGAEGAERASGAAASKGMDEPAGPFAQIFGTTRRARLLTGLTLLAIAVAVIAFIVLRSDDSAGITQDAYLKRLDRECLAEKARISKLEATTLGTNSPSVEVFVDDLVRTVTEWHSNLQADPPPPEHVEGVRAVEDALLGVLIEAGSLGTAVREGSAAQIKVRSEAVDAATADVDPALESLGLERCAGAAVGAGSTTG
jgi:zinc-ribbon domain